jgi:glucuronyl/N-acetylglucosaminyl transferase EXT2
VVRGARLGQPTLLEALAAGCVPVVVADALVLPFADAVDWRRAALIVAEADLRDGGVMETLTAVSEQRVNELRRQGAWLYDTYFSSVGDLVFDGDIYRLFLLICVLMILFSIYFIFCKL